MTSRKRDYCFTINNYNDEDIEELHKLENCDKVRYLIVGREVGDNGTPHIQGYVYFNNAIIFDTVKKFLKRAHISACRGNPEQNIAYCSKDGDFYEHGTKPDTQKRKGEKGLEYWNTQKRLCIEGKIEEIDPKLFVTHYRSIRSIQKDYAVMPLNAEDVTGEWYYGPTGSGKSRKAREDNPGFYLKMCNRWWDGYQEEDVAIIEDFDKKLADSLGYYMKIWADRYSFPAEIKGGKINIRPKKIIVTSNWHPNEIWFDPQMLEPILRRFTITQFPINDED